MIKEDFYIFGSENSTDYDIMINVKHISKNIDESHNLCKYYNKELSKILNDKPLNCNLIIINNNKIVDCFKGTVDELNNVLYYTYNLHKQFYENPILNPVNRDLNLKVVRVSRFLLSFFSRTNLRSDIKFALRNGLKERVSVLKKIDYTKMTEFPNKKENIKDIYKSIFFQFGQTFSLIDNNESNSYTKNGISNFYNDYKNAIDRKDLKEKDLKVLNDSLKRFIKICENILLENQNIYE